MPTAARSVPVHPPLSPEEDLNAAISRDLRSKMELVRELGRGAPDLTNELCQAALSEADGRISEALATLRSAQSRLESESDDLVHRRLAELGERRESLERTGARIAVGNELRQAQDALEGGEREAAIHQVVETDRRMTQFESDWRGLQGLLAQVEGLRSEAAEIGIPLGEISSEVEAIRERLREPNLTEGALDSVAQEAAQTLMLLHEAIPSALAEELDRAEKSIDRFPEDDLPSAVAKRLHLEASRHLKKGRLSEAVRSVQDLRRELAELEVAAAASPAVGPIAPPTAGETEEEMLDRLLKKSPGFSPPGSGILPPDSDVAHDAAVQIGRRPTYCAVASSRKRTSPSPGSCACSPPLPRGPTDQPGARAITSLRPRLEALTERGRALEAEGLPFPTENIRDAFCERRGTGRSMPRPT